MCGLETVVVGVFFFQYCDVAEVVITDKKI
jgi:hypothetical protein